MAQFRTKARAVDLMGKGQIADLPTAISELWKNGYDAYGDVLEAHLFETGYKENSPPLFILTDDGKGMSEGDITDKWFVLGTDSKSRNTFDIQGLETLFKEPRIKMGEKGIGRLAIAYLGPQMLMVTKKINEPIQLVFFDWRILENYNLFLDDVNVPQRSLTNLADFPATFDLLKKSLLRNFDIAAGKKDPWVEQASLKSEIISECNALAVPEFAADRLYADLLESYSNSHATRFLIFNPDPQITTLRDFTKADNEEDGSTQNYAISTLAGLFNLFKTKKPEYKTHFWIYEKNKGPYDLLTMRSFFEPEDFDTCDHAIDGDFDENGRFKGTVRIYKKKVDHVFNEHRKTETTHGPFKLKIGYVQPEKEDSSLSEEIKKTFEDKLKIYSGLFIYRDGFRVLPYGRPDTDFLEFEERRSKGAGTYFFSNRRMFGYIEISRYENGRLKDKSSREGLTNNQAYRDFKLNLIAFFKDLAKKYFATKAEEDYKRDQQDQLYKMALAEEQEKAKEAAAIKDFGIKLKTLPKELEVLEKEYQSCLQDLEVKSGQSKTIYQELQTLMNKAELCKIRINGLKLQKPTRFKPTETQTKNYHNYNKAYQQVSKQIENSEPLLQRVRQRLKIHELFQAFEDRYALYKANLEEQFRNKSEMLNEVLRDIRAQFDAEKQNLLKDFQGKYQAVIPAKDNVDDINRSMHLLENIFNDSKDRLTDRVTPYIDHLKRLDFNLDEDNLVGYYKLKFEEMKDEWNQTYELAQLGIAVEIIDHQFNALYAQLSENIRTLPGFMVSGPTAEEKFNNLSTAFDHLQNNYKLLQPIYRTTGRTRTDVTGLELFTYIKQFFDKRFTNESTNIQITPAAEKWVFYTYESVIKPVVINIVNNALYWIRHSTKKEIIFDVRNNELLILNSGEPIDDYLLDDIFKLFFSKRPNGRGIGLYLAKKSLNGAGMDIYATNDESYNKLGGACFVITPFPKK